MSLNVAILEQSFESVKFRADEFTAGFYENLFLAHPELKPLFSHTDMVTQKKKLMSSLVLVVENLRNPEALAPVLNSLGGRHISYGVVPKFYKPVIEALLLTFEQCLGEDWNLEVNIAWQDALQIITGLMLKGAGQEITPTVEKLEDVQDIPAPIIKSPSLPIVIAQEVPLVAPELETSEQSKKSLISIQVNGDVLGELIQGFNDKLRQLRSQVSQEPFGEVVKQLPMELVENFWTAPTWLVAIVAAVTFTSVIVIVDENSVLAKALSAADTVSLVLALVLFIKEAPDRRKQFHYQAWSTIDAAHNVKVSYARILALQDLNEDGVSLRGLDAPGSELVAIALPNANLSKANLCECDLSNAILSYANLDNADLSQSKLSGADLSNAKMGFTDLSKANLSSANLMGANLICANLSGANLSGANFKNANLSGANLKDAYLTGANLKNANVSDSELSVAFIEGAIMPDGSQYKST